MIHPKNKSPFHGDLELGKVPWITWGRTLPFPHPWNYHRPLDILSTFYEGSEVDGDFARHNRALVFPGVSPVFVTRDPELIKFITLNSGDRPGQFERDTMPSEGIARATGKDSLLYANGEVWKRQKKLSSAPFRKSTLFQPETFQEFEKTFRNTVVERLEIFRERVKNEGQIIEVVMEAEIKTIMIEMLTNNFFGTQLSYQELREIYVPALETVIAHIVRDTVMNKLGISLRKLPNITSGIKNIKTSYAHFDKLTQLVLDQRKFGTGLWSQFNSDVSDEALRSNIKVFLAGALEATTSFASWTLAHLSKHGEAQEKVYSEVAKIDEYTPENLKSATYFSDVLNETLRLTPSLYFLPRRATAETWIDTKKGKFSIPKGTHVLLDIWHANRHEDHWGKEKTGYSALEFAPERWRNLASEESEGSQAMHFGFGHGPRICPGRNLGQLEVSLAVGAFVKLFRFKPVGDVSKVSVGVSTKPANGTMLQLELR